MTGINKIFLAGNLGRKPVLHKSKNGKTFSFLQLATHRMAYNNGSWDKKTDWHSVLVWGKKAEICEKYLEKGSPLAIEGFLEAQNDNRHTIIADDVHFLGFRSQDKSNNTQDLASSEEVPTENLLD